MQVALYVMQNSPDPEQVQKMAAAMLTVMPLFVLVGLAIVIVPMWFICKKAGFSPWLSLLNIIPLGGLVLLYVLAFTEWKVVPVRQQGWAQMPPSPPQF